MVVLLQDLNPKAKRLPEKMKERFIPYGNKRLEKYHVKEFCENYQQRKDQQNENNNNNHNDKDSQSPPSPSPIVSNQRLLSMQFETLQIGSLLGKGGFSDVYQVVLPSASTSTSIPTSTSTTSPGPTPTPTPTCIPTSSTTTKSVLSESCLSTTFNSDNEDDDDEDDADMDMDMDGQSSAAPTTTTTTTPTTTTTTTTSTFPTSSRQQEQGIRSSDSRIVVKVLQPKLMHRPALLIVCAADLIREGMILQALQHTNILKCHTTLMRNSGCHDDASDNSNNNNNININNNCTTFDYRQHYRHAFESFVQTQRHDACVLVLEKVDRTLQEQINVWKEYILGWKDSSEKQQDTITSSTVEDDVSKIKHANNKDNINKKNKNMSQLWFHLSGGHRRRRQRRKQTLIEPQIDLLCQLAEAIEYLHSHRIMHRDLKPDNIGIIEVFTKKHSAPKLQVKVFDFDVCRILPSDVEDGQEISINHNQPSQQKMNERTEKTFHFTQRIGSPRYMAPEVARGDPYNAKADVYSFALLCYEVLTLKKVFGNKKMKKKIASSSSALQKQREMYGGKMRPILPHSWSSQPIREWIQQCWHEKVSMRPTMSQIVHEIRPILNHLRTTKESKKLTKGVNMKGCYSSSNNEILITKKHASVIQEQ